MIVFFCRRAKIGQNWGKLGLKLGRNPVWPLLGTFLAVTRRHRGVFRPFLAHWKRIHIAQISFLDDVGWCLPIFPAIRDLPGQEDQKVDFPGLGFKPGLDHMFPAGRRFGRNSAPPGSLRYFFDPSEPRLRCAISYILQSRWFGFLRPQFAIYRFCGGSGGVREFLRPPGL